MRYAAALLGAAALVGGGCGGSGDDDRTQITSTLERLFAAQESGDAKAACEDLYVIQEPERPGGEDEAEGGDCEAAFERAQELRASEVNDLSTDIGEIEITDDHATAIVHTELTRADGSALSRDQPYDLVRTDDGWRVRIADEG